MLQHTSFFMFSACGCGGGKPESHRLTSKAAVAKHPTHPIMLRVKTWMLEDVEHIFLGQCHRHSLEY
jgi:hypothetical protein